MEKGRYSNGYSYLRIGEGDRKLLVIPGVDDEMVRSTAYPRYMSRLYGDMDREVVLVSRKNGLGDITTKDLAEDYEEVLEEEGACDVMGISLGGMIAQHLALKTDKVECLVIAFSAVRVEDDIGGEWRELLEEDRVGKFYSRVAKDTFTGPVRLPMAFLGRLFWRFLSRPPVEDLRAVLRAAELHDTTEKAGNIENRTLVVGAEDDVVFPRKLIEETADNIGAETVFVDGGHAAFQQNRSSFHREVERFLDRST